MSEFTRLYPNVHLEEFVPTGGVHLWFDMVTEMNKHYMLRQNRSSERERERGRERERDTIG